VDVFVHYRLRRLKTFHTMTSQSPRIYFDNAATSFPKPPAVLEAMTRYATEIGASPGRGGYAEAREAARLMQQCRERINTLIHGESAQQIVFTLNATDALNLAIKGILRHRLRQAGSTPVHVVTTWMEHNSVLRPLNALAAEGVEQTRVRCDAQTGLVDPDEVRKALRPDTALVAITHASNVSGSLQPAGEIGLLCRERGIPFLVDASQSIGHIELDVRALAIDLLAFPGHKGLLGPLGTGALYIRPGLERVLLPLREGGTGSASERDVQPGEMPDCYEAGSHNMLGIAGLSEGVQYLLQRGVSTLRAHELRLMRPLLAAWRPEAAPPGLRLLGPLKTRHRTGVFALTHEAMPALLFAEKLEKQFGLLTRAGLHCAPLAHRTFGTAPPDGDGAVRFSLGPFLSEDDVCDAINAVQQICEAAPRQKEALRHAQLDPKYDCPCPSE
jgi:cysteine desulfurase family protein